MQQRASGFRKLFTNRRLFTSLKARRRLPNLNGLPAKFSEMLSNYLLSVGREPKTKRASHYNEEAQNNKKCYYRRRDDEISSPEEAPYQHFHYDPPNDKTTELYNNFRDNGHANNIVALRERPSRRFVPGAANPYLLSHARLYSNHYVRLGYESEAHDDMQMGMFQGFWLIGLLVWSSSVWYHNVTPELGGTPQALTT